MYKLEIYIILKSLIYMYIKMGIILVIYLKISSLYFLSAEKYPIKSNKKYTK